MTSRLECGCPTYLYKHDSWCPATPTYMELVKENGSDPSNLWDFIVFGLGALPDWDKI